MRTHFRTCNLCEAMCGIEIQVDGDQIVSIKGDANDPFSEGHICPKAIALQDIYNDPDRLRRPMKRTESGWQEISWEDAFDFAAEQIGAIQATHGRDSMGIYLGNPNVHNIGAMLFNSVIIRALRTKYRFSASSVDQLPSQFMAQQMFGHHILFPIPDVDRTDYMLMLGANPMASNGSLMTAGGIERRLKGIQSRGGKLVVIDPRRSETARIADEHHFIHPGRDALFLLTLLNVVYERDWVEPGKLASLTDGIDRLGELVKPYRPEEIGPKIGFSSEEITRIATEFAQADAAVCYGRMGLSTQAFGGMCQWLINALNIVTGNFDRAGGMMFTTPAVDTLSTTRPAKKSPRWHSEVRELPEFMGELPAASIAEEIEDGHIHGFVTVAGNPVLSTPDGARLDRALASLDFVMAIDIYINETTRHADLILPPIHFLESDHYDLVFHVLAVRNSAKYSEPLFEPDTGGMRDYEIYREIAKRLATEERPWDPNHMLHRATPAEMVDFGLRSGPYDLTLDRLKEAPHGIDLGPLQEQLPDRLFHDEKRIQLVPACCEDDLARLDQTLEMGNASTLTLIGRRHLRSNNSWMHNSRRLVKGKDRCTVMVHPQDAERLAISNRAQVIVRSDVGEVTLAAEVTDKVMPGVVSIPHGWGHGRAGVKMGVAAEFAGVSLNDLTDNRLIDAMTGNAAVNGVPVEIEPVVASS